MESCSHKEVKAAVRLFAALLGYSIVKPLQEEVIMQFLMGHDVFAVLPDTFDPRVLCSYGDPIDSHHERSGG